ncbi:MAG: Cytochrome c-type biogenesis protein CcmE, heme chaperone [Ignavibacteriae bacterium]|nr:MAG: Cytochrome c-type biogenesis protein CcmE, heme chaperone [Ignavibacteriota bacterium]
MKIKYIIAGLIIIVALIFGSMSFLQSNIEYGTFSDAISTGKKIQVNGHWVKEDPATFDMEKGQFNFYMIDADGKKLKVIYEGAKPNNFEIANSIVVKGKYSDGHFHATEILTKCPSKYDADPNIKSETVNN